MAVEEVGMKRKGKSINSAGKVSGGETEAAAGTDGGTNGAGDGQETKGGLSAGSSESVS